MMRFLSWRCQSKNTMRSVVDCCDFFFSLLLVFMVFTCFQCNNQLYYPFQLLFLGYYEREEGIIEWLEKFGFVLALLWI